jgi:hypothetical protein
MFQRTLRQAFVACLVAATACQPTIDVSGSIFLSERGQSTTTFPLVWINVYTETELRTIAARRTLQAATVRAAIQESELLDASARMAQVLTDSLPAAAITVKSDGEGRFPLRLTAGVTYFVVARASSSIGRSSSEVMEWFVWFTPSDGNVRLMLANDNLSTSREGRSATTRLGELVETATVAP